MSSLPAFLRAEPLPCSLSMARQAFKARLISTWREKWKASPHYAWLSRINDNLLSWTHLKHVADLTQEQLSLITQLQMGHAPLNGHLHRIRRMPSPLCSACSRANETTHHFLFDCRAHKHARHNLWRKLGRKSTSIRELLGKLGSMKAVLEYVAATGWLKGTFGDVMPLPS